MGNFCCKKQEDELILEIFQATEQSNNKSLEKEFKENNEVGKVKDEYPHNSNSA